MFAIIAEAFFVASVTVALISNMGVGISVDPSMPLDQGTEAQALGLEPDFL